jgi:hypothetical protein
LYVRNNENCVSEVYHVKNSGTDQCPCGDVGSECAHIYFVVSEVSDDVKIVVDGVLVEEKTSVVINRTVDINGEILNSKIHSSVALISVTNGNLTLKNLVLELTVSNLQENFVSVSGGSVYLENVRFGNVSKIGESFSFFSFVELSIINCEFVNVTNNGRSIEDEDDYGCVFGFSDEDEISIIVKNSSFKDLVSKGKRAYGGLVVVIDSSDSASLVSNCTFINCSADYYTGGLDVYSYGNLISSTMENCSFTDCYSGRDAGGAYFAGDPIIVKNCNFTRCESICDGGGMYFYDEENDSSYSEVEYCIFINCSSLNGEYSNGGGIYYETSGEQILRHCSFINCTADAASGHGGAVANVRPEKSFTKFNIYNVSFDNCTVDSSDSEGSHGDGGALTIILDKDSVVLVNISSCVFNNSFALNDGGAISCVNASLTISKSVFRNSSTKYGNGGAVYFNGIKLIIYSTSFSESSINEGSFGLDVFGVRVEGCGEECLNNNTYTSVREGGKCQVQIGEEKKECIYDAASITSVRIGLFLTLMTLFLIML